MLWIDGKAFDLSEFDHPGGDILHEHDGSDATVVFYTTHGRSTWDLVNTESFRSQWGCPQHDMRAHRSVRDDPFFVACRTRVDALIGGRRSERRKRLTARSTAWTVLCYLWALVGIAMMGSGSRWLAVGTGVLFAIVNFNVMHPSMHGALALTRPLKTINDHVFTVLSGSACPRWQHKHNVLHHAHVNTEKDGDKSTDPLVRMLPARPFRHWYRWQAVYFPIVAVINIPINQFVHAWLVATTNNAIFTRQARRRYVVALAMWVGVAYGIPILVHGAAEGLLRSAIMQGAGSAYATYNIALNHVFEGASLRDKVVPDVHWARHSVQSSANHSGGSWIGTWLSGGLNYQIEHHLFPAVPPSTLPLIAPVVQQTCKEFGVRYTSLSYPDLVVSFHKTLCDYGGARDP
jgi:linoleoyl-CoA desaturase